MNRSLPSNGSHSHSLGLPALLFTLLLCLVAQAASRPSTEDDTDIAVLPPDTDNVEIHEVRMVDGVMQADHPVIMYKEDFVSEDYDPSKNKTTAVHHKKRKHSRTHHHRRQPQLEKEEEKIYFDVLPDKPIVLNDDLEAAPVKNMDEASELVKPTKEEWLRKSHKKYHSRQRRQAYTPCDHSNYYQTPSHAVYFRHPAPPSAYYYLPPQPSQRLPVSGKKPILPGKLPIWQDKTNENPATPTSIDSRDDFLLHNSDPQEADFSIFDQPRPNPNLIGGGSGGGGSASSSGSDIGRDNTISNSRPPKNNQVWGPSSNTRPADERLQETYPLDSPVPVAASAPLAPQPSYRQEAVQYPEELDYEPGSSCHRASKLCCSLYSRNIGSLYDCFQHHGCDQSLSNIISRCS
ncbi:uncharacterized protein LOC111066422 isoform X2 [Drosophila obscura]|uniref:uncharacterized protein LOC111066422 isoform X2 n=1 Tax=Drosophila obscura TaxID=7282 RepID=UPI001BB252BB|nr:uncharacterized protein LOC111066422 isoform X2 [Drosophila obscura]